MKRFFSGFLAVTVILSSVIFLALNSVFAATVTLNPNAVGNFDQWTLGAGADKLAAVSSDDGDSSYIKSSTQGQRQTYAFPGAGVPTGSTINSVTLTVRARRAQSAGANINLIVNKGVVASDESVGDNINPNDTYQTISRVLTISPFTTSPWTVSEVNNWKTEGNSIYFGVRHNQSQSGREGRVTRIYIVVDYTPPAADTAPPTNPTVTSPSHTVSTWSNDNTVDVRWSGATDNVAVAGYSILWDTNPATVPDTTIDVVHSTDPHSATSPALASGNSHYFHLRTGDTAGNWTSTVHLGPFFIDTTEPDTSITSGPAEGSFSNSNSATFEFSGTDAHSGVAGFECKINGGSFDICTSPKEYTGLRDGLHTFQVRAVDNANNKDSSPAIRTWTVDTTPPSASIDAIVKEGTSYPACVDIGGTCFIRQKVQIQGTVSDVNLDPSSISIKVTTNDGGITDTDLVITAYNAGTSVTPCDTNSCDVTADFDTINDTNDGPNQITLSADDLATNEGSDDKMVMVDNNSPVIGSLTLDKSEYLVPEPIIVTASGVQDDLPGDALDDINGVSPAPSGIEGVGAKVKTTAGIQPEEGNGNFLDDFWKLLATLISGKFESGDADTTPFSADAAGPITATAKAIDNVGNQSESVTTVAVGLDPTNLICESDSCVSGRTATLFLGTLVNTTPELDEPVEGEEVKVEIYDSADALVFSDMVTTDSEGKIYVTNTFNLSHGGYRLVLTYEGSETSYLGASSCDINPGLLIYSLANGGGYIALGNNPKTGKPFKGTFGFFLEVTGGFADNEDDGFLNDPAEPVNVGGFNYVDHEIKEHIQSLTVDSVVIGENFVEFSGVGRAKRPRVSWLSMAYEVKVVDNGEPGNLKAITSSGAEREPDTLELWVGGGLSIGPEPLQGGNIEVR